MLKMAFCAFKIFRDNIWKMTPCWPPPLRYGIFHMFRRYFFWKLPLETRSKSVGVSSDSEEPGSSKVKQHWHQHAKRPTEANVECGPTQPGPSARSKITAISSTTFGDKATPAKKQPWGKNKEWITVAEFETRKEFEDSNFDKTSRVTIMSIKIVVTLWPTSANIATKKGV